MASMMSREPSIFDIRPIEGWPQADVAKQFLLDIAEASKAIRSRHGWEIDILEECYPDDDQCISMGHTTRRLIALRVRDAKDALKFNPFGLIMDAMLHELALIVHDEYGPKFLDLWNQLRREYTGDPNFQEGLEKVDLPYPRHASGGGARSVHHSHQTTTSHRAPSTVRGDPRGQELARIGSARDRPPSRHPPSHHGPPSWADTFRGGPPPSYRPPQSERGRPRSRASDASTITGRDMQDHQQLQLRPSSIRPQSHTGPISRPPSRGPSEAGRPSSHAPMHFPPPRRGPSSRASSRPPTERGAPPSYRSPSAAPFSTRSERTHRAPSSRAPSVRPQEFSHPMSEFPPLSRNSRAGDHPGSVKSWAESVEQSAPPGSVRPPFTGNMAVVHVAPSRASSRAPTHGAPSSHRDFMSAEHANHEWALQRQEEEWHERQAFEARDRELMARAAYEHGASDQAMYQRHTFEEGVGVGATQERMRAEATAPRRVVASQQAQMVDMMSGMALNVSQSVTVSGRGSVSGSVQMDGGRIVHMGPGPGHRTLRRTGRRRNRSRNSRA